MTPKHFFYILCGLLAIVIGGGGSAYVYMSSYLQDGITHMSQKQAEQQLQEDRLSGLQDLKSQADRIKSGYPSTLTIINKALPTDKNQSELAIQLRDLAQNSGMRITSLKFADSDAPSKTSQTIKVGDALAIPATFTLSGTYNQLQAFLTRQENLSRYTTLTNLDIVRSETSSSGDEKLNFNVTLNAFLKP